MSTPNRMLHADRVLDELQHIACCDGAEGWIVGLPSITVVASDIDRMGHVNNSIYLRWIETAVHEDWRMRATADEFAAIQWIAVRHELDYRRPAFLDEQIEISVRLTEVRRARAWYDTVVSRDGVTLCEARSCWCALDRDGNLTLIPRDTAERIVGTPKI